MAKLVTDAMLDGGLDKIATAVNYTICAGQPVSFADIAARKLAGGTITSADFTKSNGNTSGRKVTVAQQSNLSITASGTADHVVIDDGVSEYYVTTATAQALTSGGTVTGPAWNIEFADPA